MHVLSKKFGGYRSVVTYCSMYCMRPKLIKERLLCFGDEFWDPCPDFRLCLKNGEDSVDNERKLSRVSRY